MADINPRPAKLLQVNLAIAGAAATVGGVAGPTNPYFGLPYRWNATLVIIPQQHSSPTFGTSTLYEAGDVIVGDWVASSGGGAQLVIFSIASVVGQTITCVLEDFDMVNTSTDPSGNQTGNIPNGVAYLFEVDAQGDPIVYPLPDALASTLPPTFGSQVKSRFDARKLIDNPLVGAVTPATGAYLGQLFYNSADKQLLFWDGTDWQPVSNASSATAPLNPNVGQLWYDSATGQLKVWNGTDWVAIGPTASGGTNPVAGPGTPIGTLFFNTATGQLMVWNGTAWIAVGPTASGGTNPVGGPSTPIGTLFYNTATGQLMVWNGTAWVPVSTSGATAFSGGNANAHVSTQISGGSLTSLYTVPLGTSAVVVGCHVDNNNLVETNFNLALTNLAGTTYMAFQVPIPSSMAVESLKRPKVMKAGNILKGQGSGLDFTLTVTEFPGDTHLDYSVFTSVSIGTFDVYVATADTNIVSILLVNLDGVSNHTACTVSLTDTSNVVLDNLVTNYVVPYGTTVEIAESEKRLSNTQKIRVTTTDTNRLAVVVAGRKD